jgi:hypothetical protein
MRRADSATSAAQTAIAFATLVVTAALTVLLCVGLRAIARIEHDRGVRDARNGIDAIAVADAAMLRVAEELMPGPGGGPLPPEAARRKCSPT